MRTRHIRPCASTLAIVSALIWFPRPVDGQRAPIGRAPAPERVLTRSNDRGPHGPLAVDRGATGLWQELQRLRTTASLLYTAGHPDDEEAGVLTLMSRGRGARTALLTINRGEGGANAIGPELFDALGLIRSEELRLSGRYYGLDDQYFTTAVDYGYSKTLDEAFRSWDFDRVLGDMVRIIRINRPLVVVSRWHGSERDGHGHHQASGVLTPEAVRAAADPSRFPEQLEREGLRPWEVLRHYRGGVREGEPHHASEDPEVWSPWLGQSYQAFGAYGLSLQRSQTSGRVRRSVGRRYLYERLPVTADHGAPEASDASGLGASSGLFDGLDSAVAGFPDLIGETIPEGVRPLLEEIDAEVGQAVQSFSVSDPVATVPPLLRGLAATRTAMERLGDAPETRFMLAIKLRQFEEALGLATGLEFSAVAEGLPSGDGTVVPGQAFDVDVITRAWANADVRVDSISMVAPPGWTHQIDGKLDGQLDGKSETTFRVEVAPDAAPTGPGIFRNGLAENHYRVTDSTWVGLAEAPPLVVAVLHYRVGNSPRIQARTPVVAYEAQGPLGRTTRRLSVVPRLGVDVAPGLRILKRTSASAASDRERFTVGVSVRSHAPTAVTGSVRLTMPRGWSSEPATRTVQLEGPGQSETFHFRVQPPATGGLDTEIRAVVTTDGSDTPPQRYDRAIEVIRHRDLETRRIYRPAALTVRVLDVALPDRLRVGYVMGVGDDVPAAIAELGAEVTPLGPEDLATGDLSNLQTIVVGTRAYAVRPDLVTAQPRLRSWVESGGNLVVLYQTQEFVPAEHAPLPGALPARAEEISEEDAPVRILAPRHPLLSTPNVIEVEDFDGWIEQRGSKFWTEWDPAYTPLVESADSGQAPQRGIWLSAPVGDGRYTYVALALHRQLPFGVPGAYRILANLLTHP